MSVSKILNFLENVKILNVTVKVSKMSLKTINF